MAGDWIQVECCTPDKPEVVTMAFRLGIDQDAVVGKLVRVWAWADQNSIDGNAVSVTKTFLDRYTSQPGFAEAMITVGWLHGEDGQFTFPNFSVHNGRSAKRRLVTAQRVAKHRKVQNPPESQGKCNASSVTDVTPGALAKALPEKRREESNTLRPAARARDLVFEALCRINGSHLGELTSSERGKLNRACKELRAVDPRVTPEEIDARAARYAREWPDTLTAMALVAHWSEFGAAAATPAELDRARADRVRRGQLTREREAIADLPVCDDLEAMAERARKMEELDRKIAALTA